MFLVKLAPFVLCLDPAYSIEAKRAYIAVLKLPSTNNLHVGSGQPGKALLSCTQFKRLVEFGVHWKLYVLLNGNEL